MARENLLSFLFETADLTYGDRITSIREDMRNYSINQGFNVLPKLTERSTITYSDELKHVTEGQEYLSAWDFGQRSIAGSDLIRLYTTFKAPGFDEFRRTGCFQQIHNDIYEYVMEQGIYMICCHEIPISPPILFSVPHFSMHGDGEYNTVNVNLGADIIKYINEQRKKWGEPGPLSARERYEIRLKPSEKNLFVD